MNRKQSRAWKWPLAVVLVAAGAGLVTLALQRFEPPGEPMPEIELDPPWAEAFDLSKDEQVVPPPNRENRPEPPVWVPPDAVDTTPPAPADPPDPPTATQKEAPPAESKPDSTEPAKPQGNELLDALFAGPAEHKRAIDTLLEMGDEAKSAIPILVDSLLVHDNYRYYTNDLPGRTFWVSLSKVDPDHSQTIAELWRIFDQDPERQWSALWMLARVDPADPRLFEVVTDRLLDDVAAGRMRNARILMFLKTERTDETIPKLKQIIRAARGYEFMEMICVVVAMWHHGEPLKRIMPELREQFAREVIESHMQGILLDDETFNEGRVMKPFVEAMQPWRPRSNRTNVLQQP